MYATNWLGNKTTYSVEANIPLSTNWGLATEYRYEDYKNGNDLEEFMASVRYYF